MSGDQQDVRGALVAWLLERNPDLSPGDLDGSTPLIERRYLTSLGVADLLLHIEDLRGRPVDPSALRPGVFRDLDAIQRAFFAGDRE